MRWASIHVVEEEVGLLLNFLLPGIERLCDLGQHTKCLTNEIENFS